MWSISDLHVPIPFDEMEEALEEAVARGLNAELQGMFSPDHLCRTFPADLARVESAFRGFPGEVSIHSPFLDLNPVSIDPAIASVSRRRYRQAVETAEAAGAEILLFHSQCYPFIRNENYLEGWFARNREFWEGWKDALEASRRIVVLENVFEAKWAPLCRLLDALDSPRFRAALDVGHAHLFAKDAPGWAEALGDRIAYVHLHDNDGEWDLHLPPGNGTADVRGTLEILDRLEARPRINLEIYSREGILEAIQWLGENGFLSAP